MKSKDMGDDYECSGQISMFETIGRGLCGSCRFHQEVCRNAASAMYAKEMKPDERCGKWQSMS